MKKTESFASANINHSRRALVLMGLFPLLVIGLTAVTFYTTYKNQPKSTAQVATTTTVVEETVVNNLDTPWSLQFAPDGKLYFTERSGNIKAFFNGQVKTVTSLTQSVEGSEEGLQGLALHPNFASNGWLYAYYTYNSGGLKNRVVRMTINPSTATLTSGPVTLFEGIPGYRFHNGGRIKFGPDGKLYIATGAATPDTGSQDKSSLAGKILRVNDDGSGVADNPFPENRRVYSMGHRNPQGLAWHPVTGELWATEHGPSSSAPYCCNDEVNKIVKGGNYGWPRYYGSNGQDSTYSYFNITHIKPVWTSGTSAKWAPGGAMFYSGGTLGSPWTNSLIFTGLGGIDKSNQALFRLRLSSDNRTPFQIDRLYHSPTTTSGYGRLRDVIQGPDGAIYMATSNKDGRGNARVGDDKIIRLKPVVSTTPTPTPPPPAPTPSPTPTPPPPSPAPTSQSPYLSAIAIPGRIDVENYDKGGEGVAFHDSDSTNSGGKYRTDGVDVESNGSGGYNVGYISAGEWLEFTTDTQAGKYDLTFRVATTATNPATWTLKDGNTVLATATTTSTGGWYAFKDLVIKDVNISAGSNKILRLEASGSALNIDYVGFAKQTPTGTTPLPPPPPPAPTIPSNQKPPVTVPNASPNNPVPIPTTLPTEDDGSIVADFTGDGLNDIVKDANGDGQIDPNTEVIINGQNNQDLTDTSKTPISAEDYDSLVYGDPALLEDEGESVVTVTSGPFAGAKIPKPVAYTFAVAGTFTLAGIGAYLAVTKLAIFAAFRGRWGL